jgi:hypothetical protein
MSGGWFRPLQAAGDVSKVNPTEGKTLQYNATTRQWELVDKGAFGATDAVYLGDASTDGTWRIVRDGNNLSFQRREAGVWVEKGANLP